MDSVAERDVLTGARWRQTRKLHHARVDAAVGDHLARSSRGVKHPIIDFLFTYYRTSPAELRRWHPGIGVTLDAGPRDLDDARGYLATSGGLTYDPRDRFAQRRGGIEQIAQLLRASGERGPQLGCFGLHEWAMVLGATQDDVRHSNLPLRLSPEEISDVVTARPLRCTHFDAFRFFTPLARPLNIVQLTRADQPHRDQPGCLHVTMDLYKWAAKLSPATSSELVMDCFELARDARIVDMQASPYDVTSLGYEPILVEHAAGRQDYIQRQREFAARAEPLRRQILAVTSAVLDRV